ncbi:MAG: NADH-quinone oxidoreductase subunit C [Ilumatobacteraceae bacterium]
MTVASWLPVYLGPTGTSARANEMFGIDFAGHPDLRHIGLPAEFGRPSAAQGLPVPLSRMVKPWPPASSTWNPCPAPRRRRRRVMTMLGDRQQLAYIASQAAGRFPNGVETEGMTNIGPHTPATHGTLRIIAAS